MRARQLIEIALNDEPGDVAWHDAVRDRVGAACRALGAPLRRVVINPDDPGWYTVNLYFGVDEPSSVIMTAMRHIKHYLPGRVGTYRHEPGLDDPPEGELLVQLDLLDEETLRRAAA